MSLWHDFFTCYSISGIYWGFIVRITPWVSHNYMSVEHLSQYKAYAYGFPRAIIASPIGVGLRSIYLQSRHMFTSTIHNDSKHKGLSDWQNQF